MTERMVHFIADETLGGIERQYIEEPGRKVDEGDFVVIVDADLSGDRYSNGDILRVDSLYDNGYYLGIRSEGVDIGIRDYEYNVLSPTNIVRIDGKRYELADRQAEVGEEVIVTNVICGISYDVGDVFTQDDHVDDVGIGIPEGRALYHEEYNVLIPLEESEASEESSEGAPKDTHDLIASLSAEVARLSRKLAEVTEQADSNAKDIRTWADDYTQNKSEVADSIEMLTDDICTLDERTDVGNFAEALSEVIAKRMAEAFRKGGRL